MQPPLTDKRPVIETMHGIEFIDPFRWLEGDNSDPRNMGRLTDEVADWTEAQNRHTREVLDGLPGRAAIEELMRELLAVGGVSTPTRRGQRYFYIERTGDQAQGVLKMRDGIDGEPRVLIDPLQVDPSGLSTIAWSAPDPAGRILAFGTYSAGDERPTLHLLDVDSGERLADEIPGRVRFDQWLPDSSGLFYGNLESIDDPHSLQVKFHRVGTPHQDDIALFSQRRLQDLYRGHEGLYSASQMAQLANSYGVHGSASADGRWMLVSYSTDTRNNDLWLVDLERWRQTGEDPCDLKQPLLVGESCQSSGIFHAGGTLYLTTTLDAPQGRVLAIDPTDPARERWREVVPARADTVIQSIGLARDTLVVDSMRNAHTALEACDLDGGSLRELELPGIGSANVSVEDDSNEALVGFTSFHQPHSIYRVDLATGERTLWMQPDWPLDSSKYVVEQVWYPSRDGTRVSMFLVHHRDLRRDGSNPTILTGYGGFNISRSPQFDPSLPLWLDRGGVFAVANLRGGGEYGRGWHESGRRGSKQNTFDDCIAAGRWLIDQGYTRSERLAVAGGSNGGLLVGAMITQEPDLFRAVFCGVPLLDMLRYHSFLMGRYWISEYGCSEDPEEFSWLRAYSPYHHVAPDRRYPAVFLTAGENDARVHPLHARKMAAALQQRPAHDPAERPTLLWVDREAGHGMGKPLAKRIQEMTDFRMFMMWQLGMLDGIPR